MCACARMIRNWSLLSKSEVLDSPQRAPNGMGPSLHPRLTSHPDRGCQPIHGCGPLSHCAIRRGGSQRHKTWSWLWSNLLSEIHTNLIISAQQQREDSTPLSFTPPPPWRPRLSPDLVLFTYSEPTPHGSASTSPTRTSTPAPMMSSSSDKPSSETH
jgi:hypothetical protein